MTTKISKRIEQFKQECKIINLKYEYTGYKDDVQWAIVTELSEEEILQKYPEEIEPYTPFIRLSVTQGEVFAESERNEMKHLMRKKRTEDIFGYCDGEFECYHPELVLSSFDPLEEEERLLEEIELNKLRIESIRKTRTVLQKLKPIQRDRLIKHKFLKMSIRKIAQEEGVNHYAVKKSIDAATENFINLYKSL